MKIRHFAIILLSALAVAGEEADAKKVETTVQFWKGYRGKSNILFANAFQTRGRIILPDAGYVDFGHTKEYREVFLGGGLILADSKKVTWLAEVFALNASGPHAGAFYAQPFTIFVVRPAPGWTIDTSAFYYAPLTKHAIPQLALDRAKLERRVHKHFSVGAGYAAYAAKGEGWAHKPYVTATFHAGKKWGNFEVIPYKKIIGHEAVVEFRWVAVY